MRGGLPAVFRVSRNSQKDNEGREILVFPEPGCAKDASEVCPVQIIKIQ